MNQNEKVIMHCGSGITRSGIIFYTLMRLNGLNVDQVLKEMTKIRIVSEVAHKMKTYD